MCYWSVSPFEGGVRVAGAGRAAPADAHAPFCPLLAAGGRSVNLNAAFSASQAKACFSYQSVPSARVSVNLSEKEQPDGSWFLEADLCFWLFGIQNGAKRKTLDAMSRRKLGSRPQHLSAIQGKPGGSSDVWECWECRGRMRWCRFLGETDRNSSQSFVSL